MDSLLTTTTQAAPLPLIPVFDKFEQRVARNKLKKVSAEACIYFIENFLYVYEAREEYGLGWKPFKLWPRQIEYVHTLFNSLTYQHGLVVPKCRDVGASYLTLAVLFYLWLYKPNFSALVGSRRLDEVKKTDEPNTLFSKLNNFLNLLPDWLRPIGFRDAEHSNILSLINPENNNSIIGESSNPNFGRSKRVSVVFKDEEAFWEFDTSGHDQYVSSVHWRVSSINGKNHFYRQFKRAEAIQANWLKVGKNKGDYTFTFRWDDALIHDEEWFEKMRMNSDPADFAREVLMDWSASVKGLIYPSILDCPVGEYPYRPDWPLFIFMDYGWTDPTYIGFLQRDPETGDLYLVDEVVRSEVDLEFFVPFFPGKFLENDVYDRTEEEDFKILVHRRWSRSLVTYFGDPTGNQRRIEAGGQSVFDTFKKYNIRTKPIPKGRWQDMAKRRTMARAALKRLHIADHCTYFWDSFTQYRVRTREEENEATTPNIQGVHTWSHACSAFEAFVCSEPPLMPIGAKQEDGDSLYTNDWEFEVA